MKQLLKTTLAAAVLAAASASAHAGFMSFTGDLAGDNDVRLFTFSIAADADVSLRTWSYSGGTNAAGNLIAGGGFDPFLSLFYGTGNDAILIGAGDDQSLSDLDSLLLAPGLGAGTYTVALTQFANIANGTTLGDGFTGFGNAGFDGRSSAWALDILGVDSAAAVPEPATLALVLAGLAAAGAAARRSPVRV